jgi:hypothetical protein
MEPVTRRLTAIVTLAVALVFVGCSGPNPFQAARQAPQTSIVANGPPVTNDLLPERNDLTNCVGTVERANCGSNARADGHTYLVFLALAMGMAFIGWRITIGIRARDRSPLQS